MKLTDHFTDTEFIRTSHAEFQEENSKQAYTFLSNILAVATELEKLRSFIGCPVVINSGFRSPELNAHIKGSPTSQHMTGSAADFYVKNYGDNHGMQFIFDWCGHHLNYGQLIFERPVNSAPWIHFGLPRPGRERTRFIYEDGIYKPI